MYAVQLLNSTDTYACTELLLTHWYLELGELEQPGEQ